MKNNLSPEFLINKFDAKINHTGKQLMSADWKNKELYGEWLSQTYFFVSHTISFLGTLVSKYSIKKEPRLFEILKHFKEEIGHDKLLINDLSNLGKSISDFSEFPETRAFYQTQYYWIDQNPKSHIGYSLLLEGIAAKFGPKLYSDISNFHGYKSASFLKVHSLADQDHYKEGCLELFDLDTDTLNLISSNLEQSDLMYNLILKNIFKKYNSSKLDLNLAS